MVLILDTIVFILYNHIIPYILYLSRKKIKTSKRFNFVVYFFFFWCI